MDETRIRQTEQEIGSILPSKAEYVITTSEYAGIRQRMISREERKRASEDGRPQLRTRQDSGDQDRPTVRRRDDLIE